MKDEGRCGGCGARVQAADGACPYCGAAAAAPVAAATADPAAERDAVLAAIRAHPTFDALARDVPDVPAVVNTMFVVPILVGAAFIVIPLIIAIAAVMIVGAISGSAWIGLAVAAFPLFFAVVGIGTIVSGVRARRRIVAGAVRAAPAVVLAKRTEPGKDASSYYVTLAFEGGERHEFGTLDPVFRSAFEGDAGVAHCRGELLLAFRKVGAASATEVS